MLIVCPTCATSYKIEPASLGPDGRTVRCARCKTSWFAGGQTSEVSNFVDDVIAEAEARDAPMPNRRQGPAQDSTGDDFGEESVQSAADFLNHDPAPQQPFPEPVHNDIAPADAPPIVPPMGDPVTEASGSEDIESFATRRSRSQARRKGKRKSSKWTAIILVLFGFNVALIGARNEVVSYLPQTASLFAAIGLPVNLRQLTFDDVKIGKEEHDGVAVLSVEGNIVSQSGKVVEVPRLRLAVRNATGQEIYAWTTRASRSTLGPGEKLPFRARLASPPADGSDVMVRFVNARDPADGDK
jgi:predicted Zn finger-like uncharacterized protein